MCFDDEESDGQHTKNKSYYFSNNSVEEQENSLRHECIVCKHKFISVLGLPNNMCKSCEVGNKPRKPQYKQQTIVLSKLLKDSIRIVYALLGLKANSQVNTSLFKSLELFTDIEPLYVDNISEQLYYNDIKIANSTEIWNKIIKAIDKQYFERNCCDVCCDEFNASDLLQACGRKECRQRVCNGCGQEWYSDVKKGKIVNMRHLSCMFCTKRPTAKTINRWNSDALNIAGNAIFDPKMYYAWCITCNHVVEYGEQACGNNVVPNLVNYECQECHDSRTLAIRLAEENARLLNLRMRDEEMQEYLAKIAELEKTKKIKSCPFCKVMVMKTSGCNHITCQCNKHFCFECGKGFDGATQTYNHMRQDHGRIYDDEQPMYNDGYDSDY